MSEKEQKNTSRKSSNVKSIRTHTVDKKDTSQRKSVVKSKKDLKKANANTISKVSSASSDAVKNALGQVSRTALRQNDVTQDAVEMYYKFKIISVLQNTLSNCLRKQVEVVNTLVRVQQKQLVKVLDLPKKA